MGAILNFNFDEVVKIEGNIVKVRLSENSGYTYSFFNNVMNSKRNHQFFRMLRGET